MKFHILTWAVFLMFAFTVSENETYNLINSTNLAKPGCESRCGGLVVPYPFGIGMDTNCSIGKGFDIYCNKSISPPKASFTNTSYTCIKNISDSTLRRSNLVARECSFLDNSSRSTNITSNYTRFPYTFSQVNKFTFIGCNGFAWLTSLTTDNRPVSTGCMVFCSQKNEFGGDKCSGNGCCQSPIPEEINYYRTRVHSLLNSGNVSDTRSFAPCTYAFVGEENVFKFNGTSDLRTTDVNDTSFIDRIEANVEVVLDWAIGNLSCAEAEATSDFACRYSNSKCVSSTRKAGGYRCVCEEGYEGNPYLPPGCQDINECNNLEKFPCYGTCVNTIGNYTCDCKKGYSGDAKLNDGCQRKPFNVLRLSLVVYSAGVLRHHLKAAVGRADLVSYRLLHQCKPGYGA